MNFSSITENPIVLLTWITAFGMLISLTEATIKIRIEAYANHKRRKRMIDTLYPKKLA